MEDRRRPAPDRSAEMAMHWVRYVLVVPLALFIPVLLLRAHSAPDTVTSIISLILAAAAIGLFIVIVFFDRERRPTTESRWAHFFLRHSLAPEDIACVFEDFFGAASNTIKASTGRITFERCHSRWWQIAWTDPTVTIPVDAIVEIVPPFRVNLFRGLACLGNPDPVGMKVYAPAGEETFDDIQTTEEAQAGADCREAA